MEQITNYVKPELVVVAIALYFVGMALKQAQAVKDKHHPACGAEHRGGHRPGAASTRQIRRRGRRGGRLEAL